MICNCCGATKFHVEGDEQVCNACGMPFVENKRVSKDSTKGLDNSKPNQVIKRVMPSIMHVFAVDGSGSGFVIKDNLLVTCAHVIWPIKDKDGKNSVIIGNYLDDEKKSYKLIPLKVNKKDDIAILRIVDNDRANYLELSDAPILIGDSIFTIGYPSVMDEQYFCTSGAIGKVNACMNTRFSGKINDAIALNLPLFHGNSGGGVFNELGEIIGMCVAIPEEKIAISYAVNVKNIAKILASNKWDV